MKHMVILGLLLPAIPVSADEPVASEYETGDPRALGPAETRAIWDYMIRVHLHRDRDPFAPTVMGEKPPSPKSRSAIPLGTFRTEYSGLETYMAIRQADLAHELGMKAWAVDFEGGPLRLWWDVETRNGASVPEHEFLRRARSGASGAFLSTHASKGRLIFWYLPGASDEMTSPRAKKLVQLLRDRSGRLSAGIPHATGMFVLHGPHSSYAFWQPSAEPDLWADWHGVKMEQHVSDSSFKVDGETALLDIEATELNRRDGEPRYLRMKLMARPEQQANNRGTNQ